MPLRLRRPTGWFSKVLVALPLVLGACAEERPPINRVQPNALEKSFFVGKNLADPADDPEFYSAATVIDVPYGVDHGLFSGMAGGLKRLKWEIAEDRLIARATYETYTGVDGRGSRRTNNGQVIAAFPITSHFDVRRSYNPSTGEELNVVEENTSDRPWYQRTYFRVDWSQNLVTSSIWWDPLAQNELGGVNYDVEPLAYYVTDPANPDAPVFSLGEGYFDVTQKVFVTPKTLTLDGQTLPTCLWRGAIVMSGRGETGVCESSEIKVRMSFLRVKQPGDAGYHDYEPIHWDGARMDAFGAFTQDRKGYDNHYGVVDESWYRFAQRYNIWDESFARAENGDFIPCAADGAYDPRLDPSRDDDGDGTDDECQAQAAPAGSQCNPIERACTLPYALRAVRTVPWHHHLSNDNPVIVEQSQLATEEWDAAMRIAVQAARQTECRRTAGQSTRRSPFADRFLENLDANGQDAAVACEATFHVDQGEEAELKNVRALNRCWTRFGRFSSSCAPQSGVAAATPVIAFCHNPVQSNDDRACGNPGLLTRPGDLRYHSINVWPTPENSSPWGFGPSWADPLSGEIIQSSINVYNAVTDERAQRIVDKTRWFSGELPTRDILSGQYVRDRVRAETQLDGQNQFVMTKETIDHRLLGMRDVDAESLKNAPSLRALLNPVAGPSVLRNELRQSLSPPSLGGTNAATFAARIEAVKGTPLESQLVGPMWYDAAGVDPSTTSPAALELVSPLRGANARKVLEMQEAVQRRLAQNGICLYEADAPEPSSMPALGKLFDRKFGIFDPAASNADQAARVERMWNYTRGRMHYGVILHEMGHTIGERHNFTSSFDKFNYRPQYWQLRAKMSGSGQGVTTLCEDSTTDATGEGCIGPRYYDPLTPEEIDNSLYTWAQTTVMDYSGELTHDWLGLGIYDYAAARMFYGDTVDVRKDFVCPASGCGSPHDPASTANDFVDYPGYLIPQTVDVGTTTVQTLHYSQWSAYFPLVKDCRPPTDEELAPPPDWDEEKNGVWDQVFDGEVVNNEVCRRPPVSYYSWRELAPDLASDPMYVQDPQYYTPRRARTKDDGSGNSYVRVPYSFASDDFRDGWSPAILTRDAGADVYEQTLWFINQYENGHIWNNFRNGRTGFSIVNAYQSELERFDMKLANFAQGLSIIHDYYASEIAKNVGVSHSEVLAVYEAEGGFMREQAVAAGAVFDHFTRVLTRPQAGLHYTMPGSNGMYLADQDRIGASPGPRSIQFVIPNGTTFTGQDLTFGGRPLDNGFEYGQGYWYYDYINQAGSFYEKTYAFDMLLNAAYRAPYAFTRWDGIDGRWQFTNFANLFPDGIRRLMGVMLTEDFDLVAPRVSADDQDRPELATDKTPLNPIGWVSYVPKDGPEHCFPSAGNYFCRDTLSNAIINGAPANSVAVEPQLGFEIQKFLAFWAYVYMPDSQVMDTVDMMRIWKVGEDIDPAIADRYATWIDPENDIRYYSRRLGDETIFGRTYDKGIAAKMLAWANHLTSLAYEVDAAQNADGTYTVHRDADGRPIIADDGLTAASNVPRQCTDNRYCVQLRNYRGLIDFVRDMAHQVGFPEPELATVER